MSYENVDWDRLVSRLRKTCNDHRNRGMVVVKCNLVVVEGELRAWALPTVTTFEPYNAMHTVLDHLIDDAG